MNLVCVLLLANVTLPAVQASEIHDPWENVNRKVFKFNDFLDRWMLKPVARGYRKVVPAPVRRSVGNFFRNLDTPMTAVNQFLQGKAGEGVSDLGRFVVNSTLGIGGLFDPATRMGFAKHQEDFGQTFGRWGTGSGNHVVLPLRGSSTVRDTFGLVLDTLTNPIRLISPNELEYGLRGVSVVDTRTDLLSAESLMKEGGDSYLFQRDAFLQRREFLVHDGEAEESDPFLDEEWSEED
ncbi:MAG: VacJ family lipoprotein [Pseudomonadales bacterium]